VRVTVVGCAGTFPSATSPASSYLVEADDDAGRTWHVLLDLGNGALGPLQQYCDPAELDLVGLSHLHPDHVADVSGLFVYLKYHPSGQAGPIEIIGPFGTASRLGEAYGLEPGQDMTPQFNVSVWQPGSGRCGSVRSSCSRRRSSTRCRPTRCGSSGLRRRTRLGR